MKILLLMPRGALYRYESGIFRKPIRYAPLTLTSLASLIPSELNAEVEIFDEGVEYHPLGSQDSLVLILTAGLPPGGKGFPAGQTEIGTAGVPLPRVAGLRGKRNGGRGDRSPVSRGRT